MEEEEEEKEEKMMKMTTTIIFFFSASSDATLVYCGIRKLEANSLTWSLYVLVFYKKSTKHFLFAVCVYSSPPRHKARANV